jgi:DnaK suppressor protein
MDALNLTPEQLEDLHQDLRAELLSLETQLELTSEGSKPVQLSTSIGRLSRMDAMQQQQMTKASRLTLGTRLRQVRAALEGYQKGEYGDCRSCEEPIGYPRLKARPEAPFCLRCQSTREQ